MSDSPLMLSPFLGLRNALCEDPTWGGGSTLRGQRLESLTMPRVPPASPVPPLYSHFYDLSSPQSVADLNLLRYIVPHFGALGPQLGR